MGKNFVPIVTGVREAIKGADYLKHVAWLQLELQIRAQVYITINFFGALKISLTYFLSP